MIFPFRPGQTTALPGQSVSDSLSSARMLSRSVPAVCLLVLCVLTCLAVLSLVLLRHMPDSTWYSQSLRGVIAAACLCTICTVCAVSVLCVMRATSHCARCTHDALCSMTGIVRRRRYAYLCRHPCCAGVSEHCPPPPARSSPDTSVPALLHRPCQRSIIPAPHTSFALQPAHEPWQQWHCLPVQPRPARGRAPAIPEARGSPSSLPAQLVPARGPPP